MDLHLIFKDREMDTFASHVKCSLNNTVNPTKDKEVQADFICKVEIKVI